MSQDTAYQPVPYVYIDKGLIARDIEDQCPPGTYLQAMNTLARSENAMSSRYGTQVVNRDAVGSGTSNHYFPAAVTSLSRLNYQSNAWRYAGLANGSLQRRSGNLQGAYTQLTLPTTWYGSQIVLSGNPFDSLVTNCFETSQPYNFIYDQSASIKDSGVGNPQLTGIDPSPFTLNVNPYAPLLIMIDSFATANTYTVTNVTGWAFGAIETLDANSGQLITDFSQFYGIGPSGGGTSNFNPSPSTATVTATQTGAGSTTQDSTAMVFGSAIPAAGDTVSLTVSWNGTTSIAGGSGNGSFQIQYTPDGGTTWLGIGGGGSTTNQTVPTTTTSSTVKVTNLNLLQVRAQATSAGASGTITTTANITAAYASIFNPSAFGPVTNGMLSLLNTNTTVNVPISMVASQTLVGGVYTQLLVTTTAAHGLSA